MEVGQVVNNDLPVRKDGMPDLNNWQDYVGKLNLKNLGEITEAYRKPSPYGNAPIKDYGKELLEKAINTKKSEIAESFIKALYNEGLSTHDAISVLKITEHKLMFCKFNC